MCRETRPHTGRRYILVFACAQFSSARRATELGTGTFAVGVFPFLFATGPGKYRPPCGLFSSV